MICKECNSEVREGAKFCSVCGNKLEQQSVEQVNEVTSQKKAANKKFIFIILVIVAFFALNIMLKQDKLTVEEVEHLIVLNEIQNYSGNQLEIESVKITSQEKEGENLWVICDFEASNEDVYINQTCGLFCYKVDDEWLLNEYDIISTNDVKPKRGVHSEVEGITEEERSIIYELYPNIEWADTKTSLSRELGFNNYRVNTRLDDKKDQFICDYIISSNTAKIFGEMEYNYIFENGVWKLDSTNHDMSYEWNLEGIYEFESYYWLSSYYCAINIESIDWENKQAHIYYYDNDTQRFSGNYDGECWVSFTEEDDTICFSVIEFKEKDSWLMSGNISYRFTATIEDLYYTCSYNTPSYNTLGDPIGGVR